ncbi:MAG TPA: hypothetical protein VNE16_01140 [Vicinamibacterales bacterium]|nr:hypothetical protein [Vicinamibacterales bacterium]
MSEQQDPRNFNVRWVAERRPVAESAIGRDWFADEVAVDFPSVGTVVERMRETFFGRGEGDTLRTDLQISVREARDGVVVPLSVPVRRTCDPCGGRGETWTECCPACRGTGHALERRRVRLSVPPGVGDGARFRFRLCTPSAPATRVEVRVTVR